MDPLDPTTAKLFKKNRLAGHYSYVRPGEVVPHFFSRGSYYLTRDEKERKLVGVANSCLHRGYKLVTERQTLKPGQSVYCKFHAWTYDRGGELLTTPGFDKEVKPACLKHVPFVETNGLFFEAGSVQYVRELEEFFESKYVKDIWLDDYVFDQENVTFYQVNWRTFMEIYLDGYHVKPYHPGLGNYLKTDYMEWVFGKEFNIQINDICDPGTYIPSLEWAAFHEQVRKVGWDQKWGAMFGTIYPGLMLEFYPHVFVISQLVPLSNKMVANYVQIYYDSVVRNDYDFQNAFSGAYAETAQEDGVLQDILEDGRMGNWYDVRSLPNHSELEAGVKELEAWEDRNR